MEGLTREQMVGRAKLLAEVALELMQQVEELDRREGRLPAGKRRKGLRVIDAGAAKPQT